METTPSASNAALTPTVAAPEVPQAAAPSSASPSDATRPDFETLIHGEYKADFDRRVQQIIDRRFKATRALQERSDKLAPVVELLAQRYGETDPERLAQALQDDDRFYEDEARERGMSVRALKDMKRVEAENHRLRAARAAQGRDQIVARWQAQAEETRAVYPGLDMARELQEPRFQALLRAGIDVRTAYEVIHRDDILGGAMRYAAEQVRRKTVNDIRARGYRPEENGISGHTPQAMRSPRVESLSRQERERLERRALHGERITFE